MTIMQMLLASSSLSAELIGFDATQQSAKSISATVTAERKSGDLLILCGLPPSFDTSNQAPAISGWTSRSTGQGCRVSTRISDGSESTVTQVFPNNESNGLLASVFVVRNAVFAAAGIGSSSIGAYTFAAPGLSVMVALGTGGTTIPPLPSGWTSLETGANTRGYRVAWREQPAGSYASQAVSSAAVAFCHVERG